MLSLGTLRKEAPLRWTAVIAIRLVLFGVAILLVCPIAMTPVCQRNHRMRALAETSEIGKAVGIYLALTGRMPTSLDALRRPLAENSGDSIIDIGDDPWGRPYGFTVHGPRAVTLTCLGADGVTGGEGADEDVVIHWPPPKDTPPR